MAVFDVPSTLTLPAELFRPIIQRLDHHRPTLAALRVRLRNSFLRAEVKPMFFHSIGASSTCGFHFHIIFLATIIYNPHLAVLVR
ncbi:hypothetical protein BDN70DRAFT_130991 [Pholiota conissans]|uniref:Uncharacterized protein n=1 Tax=Pholiota conissans TaxID=109636 RepID=A0A9P5Z080_9AGAR|nr:hypothetical protein BDN70DRAFT_130991 [Pholiota conissans]